LAHLIPTAINRSRYSDGKQGATTRKPDLLPIIHSLWKNVVNVASMPRYISYGGDLEMSMGSGVDGKRVSLVSDEELLRTIGDDLRSFYADIIRQPLPPKIEAALARIDRARQGSNLHRPAAHWAGNALGV
jgi:hypothetical protein